MFSVRSRFGPELNPLARMLRSLRSVDRPILDLTESNPTRCGFDYPRDLFESLCGAEVRHYVPSPRGSFQARKAVAEFYRRRGQILDPDHLLLTSSTSEAYSFLFRLLADPDDEILVPQPSYPLLEYLARLEPVRTVSYPCDFQDGWRIDLDELERRITARSRAVVVVHPNNPTGSYVKRLEWIRLQEICRQHNLAILCDEVFFDYVLEPEELPLDPLEISDGLCCILNGLSKTAGLPQIKVAWIVLRGTEETRNEALRRLEIIADTFLSVSTPAQAVLPHALNCRQQTVRQILSRLKTNLACLKAGLRGSSLRALPVEGGWYAVIQVPRVRSEETLALDLLQRQNVYLHPGYLFDFPGEGFLVVSLLTPPDVFKNGLARIRVETEKG